MRMGTRTLYLSADVVIKDHPHAYGDKSSRTNTAQKILGSSPRVWGQEFPMTEYEEEDRIIPTRMGTRK